jgi:hypothetical protein
MTISSVCAAIATALDGLPASGETASLQASDPPRAKLDTAQLPAAWTLTGAANDTWDADFGNEARQYQVQVAVLPVGQSTVEEREKHVRPWIAAVRDALAGRPTLNGTAGVRKLGVLGDSGIILLPEYGGIFIGFVLRVQVEETVDRIYAAGE